MANLDNIQKTVCVCVYIYMCISLSLPALSLSPSLSLSLSLCVLEIPTPFSKKNKLALVSSGTLKSLTSSRGNPKKLSPHEMQVTFAILQFFLLRCQIANPYLGCKHCVMLQCPYGHGAGMGMFGHPLYAANDVLIQSA